ncbi:MAG: hypothetical protein KBT27_11435 [Prevotellaceae bacterium]|nr:hypothetical protein [Candidatus Faecinaster equi]
MFGALRQGSVLYVLEKSGKPELKIGHVVSVTSPVSKFMQPYSINQDTVIDISVKYEDGTTAEFKQAPTSASIANFCNAVISESKELMSNEVENMINVSRQILDNVQYHKDVVSYSESILKTLNPSFAREKETEERLASLESGMSDIKTMLSRALNTKQ